MEKKQAKPDYGKSCRYCYQRRYRTNDLPPHSLLALFVGWFLGVGLWGLLLGSILPFVCSYF